MPVILCQITLMLILNKIFSTIWTNIIILPLLVCIDITIKMSTKNALVAVPSIHISHYFTSIKFFC